MSATDDARYLLQVLTLGRWQANCTIIGDRESGTAVVIDPGEGGDGPIQKVLADEGLRCEALLLTHGHLDHLWSVPALVDDLDVEVRMHAEDRFLWDNPADTFGGTVEMLKANMGIDWDPPSDQLQGFTDGQTMRLAGLDITVRHTPGHTPGSSIFLTEGLAAQPVMVAGDLIFAGSVGRTDFPRGSWDAQAESIHRVVLPLADDTVIIAGHGPDTTVGRERATNPFVQQIIAELGHP